MKLNKVLAICSAILAGVFVVQLTVLIHQEPEERWVASWARSPKSLAQAKKLSSQIVRGRVIEIRQAKDLVIKAPGEPGGVDRIPVEVVTLALEGAYKGKSPKTVEVFHTGLSPLSSRGHKRDAKRPAKHGGIAVKQPAREVKPTLRERSGILLDDDPAYKVGNQYLLFLTSGPNVSIKGRSVRTMAVIAPQGRYGVSKEGKLLPVIKHGHSAQDL